MYDKRSSSSRIWAISPTVLLFLNLTLGPVTGAASSPEDSESAKPPSEESTPVTEPGLRRPAAKATLDPETGELVSKRVEIEWRQASPELRDRLSRRSDDLHEEPLPGGGYMVDLRGRFHTLLVAEVGADGEIRTRCLGFSGDPAETPTDPADNEPVQLSPVLSEAGSRDAGESHGAGASDG